MPFDMVVCDLDGTLLNNKKEITQFTETIIRKISTKVLVVLATARAPRDVKKYIEQLNISSPCICYNGAIIYNSSKKQVVYSKPICDEILESLFGVLLDSELVQNYLLEKEDLFSVKYIDDDVQRWINMGTKPKAVGSVDMFFRNKVSKILLRGEHFKIIPILHENFKNDLVHTFSDPNKVWLELLHRDVSKLAALKWIANYYGIKLSRVISFGDADNDLDMIKSTGMGIAMENASDDVKLQANSVALSNDEDGVALFLQEIFDIKGY